MNDFTTPQQRLGKDKSLPALWLLFALIIVLIGMSFDFRASFKLEKCTAFNSTPEQIADCYFDR